MEYPLRVAVDDGDASLVPVRSPIPSRAGAEFGLCAVADPWNMNPTTASAAITNI